MNLLLNDFKGRLRYRTSQVKPTHMTLMDGENFQYSFGEHTLWGAIALQGTMQQ